MSSLMNEVIYNLEERKFGKSFEENIVDILNDYAKKHNSDLRRLLNSAMDREEGTDLIFNGIRIDLTTFITGKDHVQVLYEEELTWFKWTRVKVRYGVRFGNRVSDFQIPVLVIGFEFATMTRDIMNSFYEDVKKHIGDIVDLGSDLYLDAVYPE